MMILLRKPSFFNSLLQGVNSSWDNAPAESFFGTLKKELIQGERYRTRQQAVSAIFEYIEVFYNRQRRHSKLGYQSPVEFEDKNQKPSLFNSPLNGGNSMFTISGAPTEGVLTSQTISGSFPYARYLSPVDGWGNIAELEFSGN